MIAEDIGFKIKISFLLIIQEKTDFKIQVNKMLKNRINENR